MQQQPHPQASTQATYQAAPWLGPHKLAYDHSASLLAAAFDADASDLEAGGRIIAGRADAVDALVRAAWDQVLADHAALVKGIALLAVGGYGRRELFPYSDVDLMFLLDAGTPEKSVKEPIRRLNQLLWDAGLRVSAMTRTLAECEKFDPENVEFTLSLLDARPVAGDPALAAKLLERSVPKLISRDAKKIAARLLAVTRTRHARYGDTLFHLEPNIKECPGGLRDAHVCAWLERLTPAASSSDPDPASIPPACQSDPEFAAARAFLLLVRAFLHLRHGRDDNTLDWQAQDAAAAVSFGLGHAVENGAHAAYWMRLYFRHARAIQRAISQALAQSTPLKTSRLRLPSLSARAGRTDESRNGFEIRQNRIALTRATPDPAHDPEIVLALFAAKATTGAQPLPDTERRIEYALPILSSNLEDGPHLWQHLRVILGGRHAGAALRSMHALGILELVIPEFHGIDALVIRDAYHRYTVDEHTFVLIDTLHALSASAPAKSPPEPGLAPWAARFGVLFRDLPHRELLLLASLLHDTGKGHAASGHAAESARMAANVLERLELDGYETTLVLDLIRNHLEMSAALRRDVFDQETIRSFAARVPNPEALRMLALFTYADITAVHPDALTPWKAENLWRLYNATANYLDRNVDDERVAAEASSELSELLLRIHALVPNDRTRTTAYLEGFPHRYLQTRTPEIVRTHIAMAGRLGPERAGIELDFRYAPGVSELTLITGDRPKLFATMAGILAGWGMNIITADAFSNAEGLAVDSFRFTDTFRTLELNESERDRFVASVRDIMLDHAGLEALLVSRKRARRKTAKTHVEARVDFDDAASTHSTLVQVIAQDTPGLLRALSLTLADHGCNIEVALVDTEGETAIDVFYLTHSGGKLEPPQQKALRTTLLAAIEANLR